MSDREWLAQRFEEERPQLRRVAYRMLGTLDETDDAVQEAWLRLSRTDASAVKNLGAWLTTVVGRVCLDMLRARRARREDAVGSWLPEPIVTVDGRPNPEEEALIVDAVGMALLVVLETLTPSERLAFVLHDMFAISYEEIAKLLERTPAATRQLASRARRRVQGAEPIPDADLSEQRRLVEAFFAAARDGDFDALLAILDPDVILRADTGADQPAQPPIKGALAVAQVAVERARYARYGTPVWPALVNGAAGAILGEPGRPYAVVGFTVAKGRITALDFVLDRDKLARLTAELREIGKEANSQPGHETRRRRDGRNR